MQRLNKFPQILENELEMWTKKGIEPFNMDTALYQSAQQKINLLKNIESKFKRVYNPFEKTENQKLAEKFNIELGQCKTAVNLRT